MLYFAIKVIVSALLIAAISEIAKRSSGFAALVASLPLTSLLAFVWLHLDGAGPAEIANVSRQILWLVIPSLLLFLLFPVLLKAGIGFWISLTASVAATAGLYVGLLPILRRLGVGI
jgi:hypothetical protein